MRPDSPPNACWTSFVGAPAHNLGDLPEKCFTCAAKQKEDASGTGISIRRADGMKEAALMFRVASAGCGTNCPPGCLVLHTGPR